MLSNLWIAAEEERELVVVDAVEDEDDLEDQLRPGLHEALEEGHEGAEGEHHELGPVHLVTSLHLADLEED